MNIAIVPARGGSKRLKRKNLRLLNGKPLVQYTLEAVSKSGQFEKIILSSDDEDILAVAREVNNITPERRDDRFSGDTVKVIDLVQSIAHREDVRNTYSRIGLFLPTCPFRTAEDIRGGIKLLEEDDFSVVSIKEMEEPVQLTMTLGDDEVIDPEAILNPSPLVTGNTRSQDFQKIFRVNGGFYIAWLKKFHEKENFFQGRVKGYVMKSEYSVDIDYEINFQWAEYLLRSGLVNLNL